MDSPPPSTATNNESCLWRHLDYFTDNPDTGATYFARRDCRSCRGEGLISASPPLPNGSDTDTCPSVRRPPD